MSTSLAKKKRKKFERETGFDVTIKRGSWYGVDPRSRIKQHNQKRKEPPLDVDYPDGGSFLLGFTIVHEFY